MWVRRLVVFAVVSLAVLGQGLVNWGEASGARTQSQPAQGEFVISYSIFTYEIGTSDLTSVWTVEVHSNGMCYANFTDIAGGSGISRASANISESFARSTFEGILSEWSDDVLRRYLDLGSPELYMEQVLAVDWYNESIGTVFEGNSMIGVMPWTYSRLHNIHRTVVMNATAPLDVSLGLSTAAGTGADTTTYVDATLENNESFNVTAFSTTLDVWPGWIVRVNGRTAGTLNRGIFPTTWTTFLPNTTTEFSAQGWNWSGASPGFYVVMVDIVVFDYVVILVPDTSGAVNREPVAAFSVDNVTGTRSTEFKFDAMMSWDWEDNGTDLEFRWDWNGDRRWDVEWTPARVATTQFYDKGEHVVTMQVRDSQGLINETALVISIDEGGNLLLIVASATLVAAAVVTMLLMRRVNRRREA